MRWAVVGAGAIGGFVGAALARGGSDVTLIARGDHLRAMQQNGVQIRSERGDFTVHPPATDDLDAVSDADAVFVGLKAYSLPEVAAPLSSSLKPGAALIAAQNGIPWWYFQDHPGPLRDLVLDSVDPAGVVSGAIDHERVVGCVVYCSTEIVRPGVIRHIEGTRFTIGEPDGSSTERCAAIAQAFIAGGLRCPVTAGLREQIWLKLIGNAALNPISALTGATLGELGRSTDARALVRTIMEECASVASALGVDLPVSIDRRLEAAFAVGEHKTSMLQDLEAGKPLELDCMTGAVIEIASRLDVSVPHTRAVHTCVGLIEQLRVRSDGQVESDPGSRTDL
jgi:2-dehydropantoate 2-reductase